MDRKIKVSLGLMAAGLVWQQIHFWDLVHKHNQLVDMVNETDDVVKTMLTDSIFAGIVEHFNE